MSQYDYKGLLDFLQQTPEQGLRKMLVDGKPMTDVHFGLLMKVVRASSPEDFCKYAEKSEFPKVKMGPAEVKLKDKFWGDCHQTWQARGLLTPAVASKAA